MNKVAWVMSKVTGSDIEAFIMESMVEEVEEIVTTKEEVEWRETCWGLPKGRGELTALDGLGSGEQEWSGDLWESCRAILLLAVEHQWGGAVQSTSRHLGVMETLWVFFIYLTKV